jgi:hypothetical protein
MDVILDDISANYGRQDALMPGTAEQRHAAAVSAVATAQARQQQDRAGRGRETQGVSPAEAQVWKIGMT